MLSGSNETSIVGVALLTDTVHETRVHLSSELKNYASKKAYETGKADPFSDYAESSTSPISTEDGNTVANGENSTATTNTNGKTTNSNSGTFFEKPNSK